MMHPVVVFDLFSFLASLVALILVIKGWKCALRRDAKILVTGLLTFMMLYSFCLVLEWSGITKALDTIEDFIGALVPMWWAFVFYAFLQEITNRDLSQSEERFRSLIETAVSVTICLSSEHRILEFNPEAERLYGCKWDEVLGQDYLELFIPEADRDAIAADMEKVLAGEPTRGFENRVQASDGSERILRWNMSRLLGSQGHPAGIIAIVGIDITDRKQAEKRAQEQLRFLQTLIDTLPTPVFYKDKDGKYAGCNKAFEEFVGIPREKIVGKTVYDIAPKQIAHKYHEKDRELFQNTGTQVYDYKVKSKSGELREVIFSKATFTDAHGKVIGLIGGISDITERKRAEEALRQSERELALRNQITNIFLTFPDDEMYTEVLRIIMEATESKYGIFGYIDEDGALVCPSMTRDIWDECRMSDKDIRFPRDIWGGIWGRALIEKKSLCSNEPFHVPKGHIPIVRALATPVIHQGEVIGNILVGNKPADYDEKDRQLVETIADHIAPILHARLQRDVKERDRALAEQEKEKLEAQLRQTQKMEAVGTLAGGIAHDFNNILTPMIIHTQMAMSNIAEESPVRQNLQYVVQAAHRAKDLVQRILTFSRQAPKQLQPLRITPIVEEAMKLLRASLPTTIEIKQNIESTSYLTVADPTQIHQVLINLCINAAHAMREGEGVLEVNLADMDLSAEDAARFPDLKPGPYVRLTVSDTGHGIDRSVIERIFDPFFTTKQRGKGTGMGLAVVHGIVKSCGGAITVDSEPEKGSTFQVFFPSTKTGALPQTRPAGSLPTGKERILLADDEEFVVEALRLLLERCGYEVVARMDGLEALEAFRAEPDKFDLVLTDQTMPHMAGKELAQELIRIRPDIPIILFTGFSEQITQEEAKAIGIREYAMKPFVMDDMARIIRKVLDENGKHPDN